MRRLASAIIGHFAPKSSFFVSPGASSLKTRFLQVVVVCCAGLGLVSCGSAPKKESASGLPDRVLASQGVSSASTFGALIIINGQTDTVARAAELSAGNSPGLMAISPTRD